MLQHRLKVIRGNRQEHQIGYTGTHTVDYQDLVRQTLIRGHVVRQIVVDTEVIPEHVAIELGCFGSTDWKSKWASVFPEAYAQKKNKFNGVHKTLRWSVG
jgi:hypothetical protein